MSGSSAKKARQGVPFCRPTKAPTPLFNRISFTRKTSSEQLREIKARGLESEVDAMIKALEAAEAKEK